MFHRGVDMGTIKIKIQIKDSQNRIKGHPGNNTQAVLLQKNMVYPEFDKEKASPEGPEMPKYKVNWRKAKEIRNAQFMDNM